MSLDFAKIFKERNRLKKQKNQIWRVRGTWTGLPRLEEHQSCREDEENKKKQSYLRYHLATSSNVQYKRKEVFNWPEERSQMKLKVKEAVHPKFIVLKKQQRRIAED